MSGFELVEPFDIDDGELDGISPQEAFVLGVEWMRWRQRVVDGKPYTDVCLANNAVRIQGLLERNGWQCEAQPGLAPGWAKIWVGLKG